MPAVHFGEHPPFIVYSAIGAKSTFVTICIYGNKLMLREIYKILFREIKQQLEDVSARLEPMLSSLPEEASLLIRLQMSMFKVLFELTSIQNKQLRGAIETLTKQMDALLQKLEQASGEKAELKNFVKTLGTMLRSKTCLWTP